MGESVFSRKTLFGGNGYSAEKTQKIIPKLCKIAYKNQLTFR